eukprot:Awhi_evm1s8720
MQLAASINHPDELKALFEYKFNASKSPKFNESDISQDLKRCYELLTKTSRSFAAVIMALDDELRNCVCLFYLVLRGLDTIEDDMTLEIKYKTELLNTFHNFLYDPNWTFTESGPNEKDAILLREFDCVNREFLKLKKVYQDVIVDITKRMATGMIRYATEDVDTLEDWDTYCHHVAGLVGIGLSQLFSASGLEDESVGADTELSNSMGLFLQKTNIIRDFLEDLDEGRVFWPQVVWKKYTSSLEGFRAPENRAQAVACLNELVTNALHHIPDVYRYLNGLKNQSVFNFCAIPQVMAIATLSLCYNNPNVFTGVVKIRKGLAVKLMMQATSMESVHCIFDEGIRDIFVNLPLDDQAHETCKILRKCAHLSPTMKTTEKAGLPMTKASIKNESIFNMERVVVGIAIL